MDQFQSDVAAALAVADVPEAERAQMARLMISEIETSLLHPDAFASRLASIRGRYRQIIEAAVGRSVGRLLIAPVPSYILPALPQILAEFPSAVLADNFKAGSTIAGCPCVTLDEALGDPRGFDACLLATVDQRVGRAFRDRLPPDLTIAAAELAWFDPEYRDRPISPSLAGFHQQILKAARPLLVLTAYLDATVAPTLEALGRRGFDIFILTRRHANETESYASAPEMIGSARHYVADLNDMLWLLRNSSKCPVLVNYARFLPTHWDMRNTLPLFAYSVATVRAIAGPSIIHLYDAYQVCTQGLEAAPQSFSLYFALLRAVDGILVNAEVVPILQKIVGPEKAIISFLRYGPEAPAQPEPDDGPFSIAVITNFLGETADPTRATASAIRGLLRQGLHVHYYSSSRGALAFGASLDNREAWYFHLHAPIGDQSALVTEISRYHAGWFVADVVGFAALGDVFSNEFARELADSFIYTAISTASILYGCAGLPCFFQTGLYTAKLFPRGTTIEINHEQAHDIARIIAQCDWQAMRRATYAARHNFCTNETQIARLATWLDKFQ